MSKHAGTVLVYMKYPAPGQVKTRLAAAIGPDRAAKLYQEWIGLVLGRLQPVCNSFQLIGAIDGADAEAFTEWEPFVDAWWRQPEGDLGHRLDAGFAHVQGRPTIAIGTDCLEICPDTIHTAFRALRGHDAVFGPTFDGGYYLVGTAQYLRGFFDGIRWSSEHTFADHQSRCIERGWSVGLLPSAHDIDTWDDWIAYCARTGPPLQIG